MRGKIADENAIVEVPRLARAMAPPVVQLECGPEGRRRRMRRERNVARLDKLLSGRLPDDLRSPRFLRRVQVIDHSSLRVS